MKTGILLAAIGGVDAAWHTPSWSDREVASGTGDYAATLCPEDGYRERNWKIELHSWSKHGDVCRATDGSTYWEIPAGCEYHMHQSRIYTRKKGSTDHSPCRVDHTQMPKVRAQPPACVRSRPPACICAACSRVVPPPPPNAAGQGRRRSVDERRRGQHCVPEGWHSRPKVEDRVAHELVRRRPLPRDGWLRSLAAPVGVRQERRPHRGVHHARMRSW